MRRVCVFCGSSRGGRPVYREAARRLGEVLVARGIGLVYGGAQVGTMGTLADAVLQGGGEIIGVIPQRFAHREVAHQGLPDLRVVSTMAERKTVMAELADAFIALPGGIGTLDEICEMMSQTQLGFQAKPCGLLNVEGFYDPFVALLDHMVAERFLRAEHRGIVLVDAAPAALLDQMRAWHAPGVGKRGDDG